MEKPQGQNFDDIDYLQPEDVVSSMECTGLIPTPPTDEAESESYTNLYSVPKQGSLKNSEDK